MTLLEISGSLNMIGYGLATLGPGIGVALDLHRGHQRHSPAARGSRRSAQHRLDRLRGCRGARSSASRLRSCWPARSRS